MPAPTSNSHEMEGHRGTGGGHLGPGGLRRQPGLSPDRPRHVRASGRPGARLAVPLPGTITARAVTGETFTTTAGKNGRFKLSLPTGSYHVTGRSPLMQSGQMTCAATAELRVTRDKPAGSLTVVCSIP